MEAHGVFSHRRAPQPGPGEIDLQRADDSSQIDIRQCLSTHPVFGRTAPVLCRLLAHCAAIHSYPNGAFLSMQGLRADRFYLPLEQDTPLECFSELGIKTIDTVSPGDLVGISWCFAPYRWRCTLRLLASKKLMVLDAGLVNELFRDEAERYMELRMALLNRFLRRLHCSSSPCIEYC